MIHVDRTPTGVRIVLDLDAARQLREVCVAEWRRNKDRTARALAEALTRALR